MSVHDFAQPVPIPEGMRPTDIQVAPAELPALRQTAHAQGGRVNHEYTLGAVPYDVEEFLIPGFRALDEAMKRYWMGIRVPTKDSYRFMRVKVAGGDKSLLIWRDELAGGRARLPVAAVDRTGHQFNPEKYSPAIHPMNIKYPSRRGDLALMVFRPLPYLVHYDLLIWAERKRDADFILYQVLARFSPLAEFRMFDGKLQGTVVLNLEDSSDVSDKETGYDQHANVRYEVSLTAEAWLPLPEILVPTVLGQVYVLKERLGTILDAFRPG